MFKALEAHPEITSLMARIVATPTPAAGPDGGEPLVAEIQYKYLFVTSFGRQFYEACEYRPDGEG